MYLKRLELQGFKSFADRTILEFKPGITSVIGPNGSGKSNISDAIRWVLGEQSIKSLRGSKSEDIIFAGTQNRKSLGFAEVSIVFDNEEQSLPIEYSEVTVTRKLYRTGETGYFINKVPCRLKDIYELFMDTGIGKDGYSIIGQGKIDEILSNKSGDRRHIFEEAAGIVKYRVRREESEKKLEQTKVNLIRINDILAEIEANLDPLKLQAEKARKFLDLREELKNIEVGLFINKIDEYKQRLQELEKNKDIFESQNIEENNKLNNMQELKETLKQEIDNITEEIEKLQYIGTESKTSIEKINSSINVSKERISNNLQNKNRLENEITLSNKNILDLEEEKQTKEVKKENLRANKEKFETELNEKETELSKLTEKLSGKEIEIENKKKETENLTEQKYELQNQVTAQETNYQNAESRKKQEEKELIQVISELDKKREVKNEISKHFSLIETERNSKELELEKAKKDSAEIEKKSQEYNIKIENLIDEKRLKTSKYNFLVETEREKEGYAKAVKELLIECENNNELKNGLSGVLANVISTDEKYQTAIEMALGASLQNVVTNTEQDAKKMIEFLRRNNIGRASFLPISSIKGRKLEKEIRETDGVIGIASDLVKSDKKYENIILNLLGRTVIVENMDCAIKLAKGNGYSFKIVTLEGDIINPTGSISGGAVTKKTVNLLGRSVEIKILEKQIKDLVTKIENKKQEKEEYLTKNAEVLNKIDEMSKEMQQAEITYATEKEKVKAIENEVIKLENTKNNIKNEITKLEENMKNIIIDKQKIQTSITEITIHINDLTEEINEFARLNKDDQKYIEDLNLDITNLKISVSSFDESGLSIDEMVERIQSDIEDMKNGIALKKQQIEENELQNNELEVTIKEMEANIEKIKAEVEGSGKKQEELKKSRVDKNDKLDKTEKDIEKQFETIQKVKEQIVKVDAKKTSIEQDITDTVNELWNEYEITPNNAAGYEKPTNIKETEKKAEGLHTKIKELGSVNVDSIEEYKKTKERYETMNEQRMDLETTMAKLRDIIQEMTENMKKQFSEKFEKINLHFNEVFVELFGGGKAELILEDENNLLECGIDIQVQPTGKKLQNMSLLSGGERALTAIALLFAILKINPSPFCILDEIEAALDDVNVYRFAEFLKKFSKKTQFLVITHRKGTMEAANTVYGVTMEENGVSKLLSINLK